MKRTHIITDIHGCSKTLLLLLDKLELNFGDKIIFLGDYIDRGPNSKEVIDIIMSLQEKNDYEIVCLRGNHEEMCLAYFRYAEMTKNRPFISKFMWLSLAESFHINGGYQTLESFAPIEKDQIPDKYLNWMDSLLYIYEDEYAYYVHAGFRPKIKPYDQNEYDMTWIRNEFLYDSFKWDKIVVHGHTPNSSPEIDERRICVDTGCVFGDYLTALSFPEKNFTSVKKSDLDIRKF